jgi:hypothetical protein
MHTNVHAYIHDSHLCLLPLYSIPFCGLTTCITYKLESKPACMQCDAMACITYKQDSYMHACNAIQCMHAMQYNACMHRCIPNLCLLSLFCTQNACIYIDFVCAFLCIGSDSHLQQQRSTACMHACMHRLIDS